MKNIAKFRKEYKSIREMTPIYKGDFSHIVEEMPQKYWQKFLFDEETKTYYCALSFEPIEWWFESDKKDIKEPNEGFIEQLIGLLIGVKVKKEWGGDYLAQVSWEYINRYNDLQAWWVAFDKKILVKNTWNNGEETILYCIY